MPKALEWEQAYKLLWKLKIEPLKNGGRLRRCT